MPLSVFGSGLVRPLAAGSPILVGAAVFVAGVRNVRRVATPVEGTRPLERRSARRDGFSDYSSVFGPGLTTARRSKIACARAFVAAEEDLLIADL